MTARDLGAALRRSWALVALAVLLGCLGGIGWSKLATPTYLAEAQVFVSVEAGDGAAGSYEGSLYVQSRMKTYVALVDTPEVLDPVIKQLELDTNAQSLASHVNAVNPDSTVLISVTADGTQAAGAAKLADATAKSLGKVIVELETTASGTKPIKAELFNPAVVPESPVLPRPAFNLALGAMLGILAGLGIALLRSGSRSSIDSVEDLAQLTGIPVLGTTGRQSRRAKTSTLILTDARLAEDYRAIRTSLRCLHVSQPPRCIVITSAVPGQGSEAVAANLAIAMAQGGSKVLLVETDLHRAGLTQLLAMKRTPGLTELATAGGGIRAVQAFSSWSQGLLDVLNGGSIPAEGTDVLASQAFADLLASFVAQYDTVILHAPAVLTASDASLLAAMSDGTILVAVRGRTRKGQIRDAAAVLDRVNGHLLGTVYLGSARRRSARRNSVEVPSGMASLAVEPHADMFAIANDVVDPEGWERSPSPRRPVDRV